jgi:hypothetical protein
MAEKRSKKREERSEKVNTAGGAYVGGTVNTDGGDFVGRDKNITGGAGSVVAGGSIRDSTVITGSGNTVGGSTQNIFAPVYQAIQSASLPAQQKEDLSAEVEEIEGQIVKSEAVDEGFLARRLRAVKRMGPDIFEVLLAALNGPGAVVSAVAKKVAERVKAEG